MLFRSLRSLGRRAMVAGAACAVALTAFNAVQPSLGGRRIHPGTVRDVQLTLTPAPSPAAASASLAGAGAGRAGRAVVASPPVAVGKARFVGFSWADPTGGLAMSPPDPRPTVAAPSEGHAGLWLRTRGAAGWSGWQEVEVAGDGPDPGSPEHHPGRVFTEGVWLPAGTKELQVKVARPTAAAAAPSAPARQRPRPPPSPPPPRPARAGRVALPPPAGPPRRGRGTRWRPTSSRRT